MANIYVRSGAGGAGTGADWANAYTTLKAAAEAAGTAAGDSFWVSEDHAETTASNTTITFKGTAAAPDRVTCVNHAGTVPPVSADLATSATVTTTSSGTLGIGGYAKFYGITISCGSGASGIITMTLGLATHNRLHFKNCALKSGSTTSSSQIAIGSGSAGISTTVLFEDTTVQVAAAGASLTVLNGVEFRWYGSSSTITGATVPTTLFTAQNLGAGRAFLDGVDLNPLSGKTLVGALTRGGYYYLKDCRLPASITINATLAGSSAEIYVMRSASGATAYNLEKHTIYGDQTLETTVVRSGGKTMNGTPIAIKMISSAGAAYHRPFESTVLVAGSSGTGSKTVTVYGVWSGGSVPTDKEVWMEVGYLGNGSYPQASFDKGTGDELHAGTNQATDSSSWGGGTTVFKMTASITTALAGPIYVVVKSASTNTVYIDPKPVIT